MSLLHDFLPLIFHTLNHFMPNGRTRPALVRLETTIETHPHIMLWIIRTLNGFGNKDSYRNDHFSISTHQIQKALDILVGISRQVCPRSNCLKKTQTCTTSWMCVSVVKHAKAYVVRLTYCE